MISFEGQRELAGYLGGLFCCLRAIQWRIQVDALASAGHRDRVMADVAQDVSHQLGNPGTRSSGPRQDQDQDQELGGRGFAAGRRARTATAEHGSPAQPVGPAR